MKKLIFFILAAATLTACKSTHLGSTRNLEVRLLDDYAIEDSLEVDGTLVGGLSGLDYHDGQYYMVSDHPGIPRFYKADIRLSNESIDTIIISEAIRLSIPEELSKNQHFDLEGIRFDSGSESLVFTSEGAIKRLIDPSVFRASTDGEILEFFSIPNNLKAISEGEPRNNGSFEGLAESYDKKGWWVAMELPLKSDGPTAKPLIRTKSPVRITLFDKESGKAVRQFPYRLEPNAKIPWLYFAVNGVTDLLEYAPDKFLVLERGFAAGHGQKGNTVRIYDVDANLGTNTLDRNNLRVSFYNPAKKELVYDFKWAKKILSDGFIDNIEAMAFGPALPNGNQSLILIADNNFNSMGQQVNQVILMEIKLK